MKKVIFISIILLVYVLLLGCGITGGTTELKVKVGGKERTLNGKASYVSYSEVSPIGASFHIANFDPKKIEGKSIVFDELKNDDDIRITFNIIGTGEKPDAGEYPYGEESGKNRSGSAVITYNKEGTSGGAPAVIKDSGKGVVRVTSVTDSSISGTIDISDDENSIKGNFTATLLKNNK